MIMVPDRYDYIKRLMMARVTGPNSNQKGSVEVGAPILLGSNLCLNASCHCVPEQNT